MLIIESISIRFHCALGAPLMNRLQADSKYSRVSESRHRVPDASRRFLGQSSRFRGRGERDAFAEVTPKAPFREGRRERPGIIGCRRRAFL
jgi:hypothetical protein